MTYIIRLGDTSWLSDILIKKEGADERFYKLLDFTVYSTDDWNSAKRYGSLSIAFTDFYKILDYNPKLRPVIEEA